MGAPWLVVANNLKGVSENAGAVGNPKIIEMYKLSGHPEVQGDETPWCAAFVGACLRLSGFKCTGDLGARSYFGFGKKLNAPVEGCIVVFWRESKESYKGHVAFFKRVQGEQIVVLGGKQGDQVCEKAYCRSRL